MASTNYTELLGLCQWEAQDPVLREDFNADNRKIEAAIQRNRPVTGTYTGSGINNSQEISLGFRPAVVIIMPHGGKTPQGDSDIPVAMALDGANGQHVVISDDGFTVSGIMNVQVGSTTSYLNRNPLRFIAWH